MTHHQAQICSEWLRSGTAQLQGTPCLRDSLHYHSVRTRRRTIMLAVEELLAIDMQRVSSI